MSDSDRAAHATNDAASSLGQSADLGSPALLKPVRPLLARLGSVRT
jgi:hypothetical protein